MTSPRTLRRFVVCLSNRRYPASLERRKLYVALKDASAERVGMLRIIDESGEDYLYPRDRFAEVSLPAKAERMLEANGG